MDRILEMLAKIEAKRAAMAPADRAKLEAEELAAQRESWMRGMAPCEHGDPDWETCPHCLEKFGLRDAQAIEARRAETGTGSVHESAVRKDGP